MRSAGSAQARRQEPKREAFRHTTSKGFSPARLSLLVAIDVPIWTYVIHSNFIRRSGDGLSCARASQPRRRATSDLSSAGTTQPAGARAPRRAPLLCCASRSPMSEAALLAFSDIPGLASALPERSDTGMDAALGAFREVPTAPSRPGSTEAEPAGRAEPAEPAEVGESSVSLASVSEGRALPDTEMDAALSAFQENPTAPSWPGSTEAEPAGRAEPTGSEHAGSQLPPAGSEQPHAGSGIVPTPLAVDGHVDQIHPQAMQAFAADIAAEEAAPASPESRLEHQRKEALKEAMKLVD